MHRPSVLLALLLLSFHGISYLSTNKPTSLIPQAYAQNQPNTAPANPIQLYIQALQNKNLSLLHAAINAGLDIQKPLTNDGITALMGAAEFGYTDAIKALIQAGANIEAKKNDGWNPLMIAAYNGHTEAVKVLYCQRLHS